MPPEEELSEMLRKVLVSTEPRGAPSRISRALEPLKVATNAIKAQNVADMVDRIILSASLEC